MIFVPMFMKQKIKYQIRKTQIKLGILMIEMQDDNRLLYQDNGKQNLSHLCENKFVVDNII